MDEIKRALLGDEEAQRAVTDKGKLLPCPKCYSQSLIIKYFSMYTYVECLNCGCESGLLDTSKCRTVNEAEKAMTEEWNTRPQLLTEEELERLEGME